MSVKLRLIIAPIVVLGIFCMLLSGSSYHWAELERLSTMLDSLQRQDMYMQMLLRGINESILNNDTPHSNPTIERAIEGFQKEQAALLQRDRLSDDQRQLILRVDEDWQHIKRAASGGRAPDQSERLVIVKHADGLVDEVNSVIGETRKRLSQAESEADTFLVFITAVTLVAILALSVHLYRSIAIPLHVLRKAMGRVSDDSGELLARVVRASAAEPLKSSAKQGNRNEIVALVNAYRYLLDNIRDHLVERQRAEDSLQQFSLFLEQRVKDRTRALEYTVDALRESEGRFRSLYEKAPLAYQSLDEAGYIIDVNQAWLSTLGYQKDEVLGRWIGDFFPEKDRQLLTERFPRFKKQGEIHGVEFDMLHRNGMTITVALDGRVGYDEKGQFKQTHCILADVTERKRAEQKLRLAANVFENTTEGVIITDVDGNIIAVNRAFTEITGYQEDEVIGEKPALLRSDRHDESFYRDMWKTISQTGCWRGEIWNRHKTGGVYPEWLTISTVRDETGHVTHHVGVFADISVIKESEEKLAHLAHHDALTDLPNRLLIRERIEHALARARRRKRKVVLLFLDVDRFKHINDSFGHATGDELLQAVAGRLVGGVREADTVGRLGGDEFIVILDDVSNARDASAVAQKLMDMFVQPFKLGARELYITPSIGVSLSPDDGEDAATLLKNADAAMHKAKEQEGSSY